MTDPHVPYPGEPAPRVQGTGPVGFLHGERVAVTLDGIRRIGEIPVQPTTRIGESCGVTLVLFDGPPEHVAAVPTDTVRRRGPRPYTRARCPACDLEIVFDPGPMGASDWRWYHRTADAVYRGCPARRRRAPDAGTVPR